MNRIPYLAQAHEGRARAFDFIMGSWFILLAWVISQMLFQSPLMSIGDELGVNDVLTESFEDMNLARFAVGALLVGAGTLMGVIFYLAHRTTRDTLSKVFGWLALIGVVLSLIGTAIYLNAQGEAAAQASMEWLGAILSQSPVAYGFILLSFIGAFIGAWLVQRFIHFRTFQSLVTAAARIRWSRIIWTAALTWGIYAAVIFVSSFFIDSNIYANPERSRMIPFVIATLLFIPIQCAAEELMFRGYLNQALGRFIPSALFVFVISSIAFGALHLANPEIGAAKEAGLFWLVFASYIIFGLILSFMVWIDNGLESAIGVHTANNAWIAIFINYEGSVLPVPGMFLSTPEPSRDIWLGLITLLCVLAGIWVTRKPLGERISPLANPDAMIVEADTA